MKHHIAAGVAKELGRALDVFDPEGLSWARGSMTQASLPQKGQLQVTGRSKRFQSCCVYTTFEVTRCFLMYLLSSEHNEPFEKVVTPR